MNNYDGGTTSVKQENLTTAVVAARNKLQPHFKDNTDILLFDYDFYTKLESLAKKEREKSKEIVLGLTTLPKDTVGTLVRTKQQILVCKKSAAPMNFDLELFLDTVVKELKVDKHKLREIAAKSKLPGSPRTSYSVEQIDE